MESAEERIKLSLNNSGHYILSLASICKETSREEHEIFYRTVRSKEAELSQNGVLLVQERSLVREDMDSDSEKDSASVGRIGRRVAARSERTTSLDPALWGTLPLEILQHVFAHLPLPDIIRLRKLSPTWNQFVTGRIPGFTKVCARVNPKVWAMLGEYGRAPDIGHGLMQVRLYDIDSGTWHEFKINIAHINASDGLVHTMCAGDGGLVCLVSTSEDKNVNPVSITVLNPLTRQWRVLPALPQVLSTVQPSMVQLVMDRDSKCYKVIVVGPRQGRGGAVRASIYSSEIGRWRIAPNVCADPIFGHGYTWEVKEPFDSDDEDIGFLLPADGRAGPCVCDCANSKLIELDEGSSPWSSGASEHCSALVKDKVFVLLKDEYMNANLTLGERFSEIRYSIYEYQIQVCQPHWVKWRVHRLHRELDYPPRTEYYMNLYACNGFLLLTARNREIRAFKHEIAWLYDMSTYPGKWQAIPPVPKKGNRIDVGAMFELQWDAVP